MKKCPKFVYGFLPIILMGAIGFIFFGCPRSQTQSNVNRRTTTGIQEGDKIVVVINTEYYSQSSPKEKNIVNCISNGFKKINKDVKFVPAEQFRSLAFSDIEINENSNTKEAIDYIVINTFVLGKIKSVGIRYIVLVDEPFYNRNVSPGGTRWEWVGSPLAAPVAILEKSWSESFTITGKIFDIQGSCMSGSIFTCSSGESELELPLVMGLIPFIPVYWISNASEFEACQEFGKAVAKFIEGQ